jgi:hypothetical protein
MSHHSRITICITKDQYDEDHITQDDQGVYQWTWNGMNNGAFDHKVGNGAHIFYREKPCTPFTFYGKIAEFQVIRERTEQAPMLCKFQSSRGNLPIPFGTVCDDIQKDETFCYKRALCRALGLSQSYLNYGIIEHDEPPQSSESNENRREATAASISPRAKADKRRASAPPSDEIIQARKKQKLQEK